MISGRTYIGSLHQSYTSPYRKILIAWLMKRSWRLVNEQARLTLLPVTF